MLGKTGLWLILLVLTILQDVLAGRDYYEVLGLKRDCNEQKIKKAYRELSKKWHPDKNKDNPDAHQIFVEIATAYETLIDKDKRRIYDTQGEEGLKQHASGQHARDPFDLFSQFSGFGDFFGGGGGQRGRSQEEQRGPDVTIDLQASLEDLYNGKVVEVAIKHQTLCPKCRGSGAKNEDDVKTCPVCKGKGIKITVQQLGPGFVQQMQSTCERCGGKGKIASSTCPHCQGKKVVSGEHRLDVYIEAGMPDGHLITFENAGDESPDRTAGHVNFKITTAPHPRFRRQNHDLHFEQHISLLEALVGFSKSVTHLDGHEVKIQSDKVIEHGHVMTIKGEGMPHHNYRSKKGDLYVKFIVDFPKQLSKTQRTGFAELLKSL